MYVIDNDTQEMEVKTLGTNEDNQLVVVVPAGGHKFRCALEKHFSESSVSVVKSEKGLALLASKSIKIQSRGGHINTQKHKAIESFLHFKK